jgi:DNA invertase Pin-like site-specific DNA recombinase
MARIVAYLRTSTDKQDLNNQKLVLHEHAHKQGLIIDEFIEKQISSRKSTKERRIDELKAKLEEGDTLLITEVSRLGRSTYEILTIINELTSMGVRIISLKENLNLAKNEESTYSQVMLHITALFVQIERDLASRRTKEALSAKKAKGIKLGRPKGAIVKSKFDDHHDKIMELAKLGVPVKTIHQQIKVGSYSGLLHYVNKRVNKLYSTQDG